MIPKYKTREQWISEPHHVRLFKVSALNWNENFLIQALTSRSSCVIELYFNDPVTNTYIRWSWTNPDTTRRPFGNILMTLLLAADWRRAVGHSCAKDTVQFRVNGESLSGVEILPPTLLFLWWWTEKVQWLWIDLPSIIHLILIVNYRPIAVNNPVSNNMPQV